MKNDLQLNFSTDVAHCPNFVAVIEVYSISNGNNHIKVVILDVIGFAIFGSCQGKLDNWKKKRQVQ